MIHSPCPSISHRGCSSQGGECGWGPCSIQICLVCESAGKFRRFSIRHSLYLWDGVGIEDETLHGRLETIFVLREKHLLPRYRHPAHTKRWNPILSHHRWCTFSWRILGDLRTWFSFQKTYEFRTGYSGKAHSTIKLFITKALTLNAAVRPCSYAAFGLKP